MNFRKISALAVGLWCVTAFANSTANVDSTVFRTKSLEEVVITANRDNLKKIYSVQQVLTLPSNYVSFANAQNMSDLLLGSGGVAVQKSQQGGGSPILRGFEASRVLLVVDGVRMNNLIYRSGHLQNSITVDQFVMDKVEVLNGSSSLEYGSDALGGTIVFSTKDPMLGTENSDVMGGNAVLRYGSVNNEGTSHFDFNYGTEKFASFTSLTYSHFGDLKSGDNRNSFLPKDDAYIVRNGYVEVAPDGNDRYVVNPDVNKQVGSGYMQYDLLQKFLFQPRKGEKHLLNFQLSNTPDFNRYDRLTETKVSNGEVLPKSAEWYYGPQFRLMASYSYKATNRWGADNTNLTVAYQKVKESRHNRDFGSLWLSNRWENVDILTLNSDWIKRYGDSHKLHLGVDGTLSFLNSTANLENVSNGETKVNTTRYPDGDNRMHTVEGFAMHSWEITPNLRMNEGLRLGYAHVYSSTADIEAFPFFDGGDMRRDNLTYSLAWGLNYLPARTWKIATSLATAYRVPNIDNTSKVFDSKTSTVTIPNPDLKPEKTVSLDVNITKHISDIFVWENVFFATYYFDAITVGKGTFKGENTMIYDGQECTVYTNVNSNRAFLWGYSMSLTAKPTQNIELGGTFNYTYGRLLSDSKGPLDHIPPIFGKVGIAYLTDNGRGRVDFYTLYNGKKSKDSYNLEGEDNIKYATVNGEDGEGMPAWFTLNIKGSYSMNKVLTLQAGVENLLDTQYRCFASGINAPGRNIYAALRLKF